MAISLAIAGFRHGHIFDLVQRVQEHPGFNLVALCEEHGPTREALAAREIGVPIFDDYAQMLRETQLDAVAVGDAFGLRGGRVIEALRQGKHVISDKPICTSLEQLDEIESLAKAGNLTIGCMLTLRDSGNFRALKQVVDAGTLGEVQAVTIGGQHPLNYGNRPAWYFEPGLHGGTINDVGIHAYDLLPWITGFPVQETVWARTWNAGFTEEPGFETAAQVSFTLVNGAGVQGDFSYLMPNSFGFSLHQYWRTTVWGTKGMAETSPISDGVLVYAHGTPSGQRVTAPANEGGYLEAFYREVAGLDNSGMPDTQSNLQSQRAALQGQAKAADRAISQD